MKRIEVYSDESLNEPWVPPFMIHYTKKEEQWIERLWKLCGNKYIVDPLGYDQCIALQYDELPRYMKLFFNVIPIHVTYEDYKNGRY